MQQVFRTELMALIRDPAVRFTALIAGIGYGKTSLLAALARDPRSVLVRLSDADVDPVSIAGLFAAALARLGLGSDVSQLSHELRRPQLRAAAAARALCGDLARCGPLTLLIDGAELLEAEGRAFFLHHLLPALPAGVRMVVSMNAPSNLPIQHLRLLPGLSVRELHAQELAFDEATMLSLGLSGADITRTRGWPAAVMFAHLGDDPALVTQHILSTMPDDLRPTLRRASLLPEWRLGDVSNVTMQLRDGWLLTALEAGLPCIRVDARSYEPHPLVREALLRALRDRPAEYQAAQRGLAESLREHQPLGAATVYLDGGDEAQARAVLAELLPTLQGAEQLSSAYALLGRLELSPADPLSLHYAQAAFDHGEVADGLRRAALALEHGAARVPTLSVVAGMRLRSGDVSGAAARLGEAIEDNDDPAIDTELRASRALALSLSARGGQLEHARLSMSDARRVIERSKDTSLDSAALLKAYSAMTLSAAVSGARPLAARHARLGIDLGLGLGAGRDAAQCLTLLAGQAADEGDGGLASALLAHVRTLLPDVPLAEDALHLALATARALLRAGESQSAAHHASRASRLAAEALNIPARREALVLLAVTALLPPGAYTRSRLDELRAAFGSEPGIARTLSHFDAHGTQAQQFSALSGDHSLPLEARLVLSVAGYSQDRSERWMPALRELRSRLGLGALGAAAALLGVTLPPALSAPLRLRVSALRPLPSVTLNGSPLLLRLPGGQRRALPPRVRALVLALSERRRVQTATCEQDFGALSRVHFSHELSRLCGAVGAGLEPGAVMETYGRVYGGLDAADWLWETDIDDLEHCHHAELIEIYRSPVFAGFTEPWPVIAQMRGRARASLSQRHAEWAVYDAARAAGSWAELRERDPALPERIPDLRVSGLARQASRSLD